MFLIVLRLPLCMKSSVAQAKGTAQEAAAIQINIVCNLRWSGSCKRREVFRKRDSVSDLDSYQKRMAKGGTYSGRAV